MLVQLLHTWLEGLPYALPFLILAGGLLANEHNNTSADRREDKENRS